MAIRHTHPMDAERTGSESTGPTADGNEPPRHGLTQTGQQIIVTPGGQYESGWPLPPQPQGEGYFLWHPDCLPQRLPQSVGWR